MEEEDHEFAPQQEEVIEGLEESAGTADEGEGSSPLKIPLGEEVGGRYVNGR